MAIQHYKAIEERATHHIKKWRSLLTATAGLSGDEGREATVRRRYLRAVRWWVDFLADHRARWPHDDDVDATGAALVVEENGDTDDQDLLPLPHTYTPASLGPIVQRYAMLPWVSRSKYNCEQAHGCMSPTTLQTYHGVVEHM